MFLEEEFTSGPDQVLPTSAIKTSEPNGATKIPMAESGPSSEKPVSVYTFLKRTVDAYGNMPALSVKREGTWSHWSFKEHFDTCCIVAKAFIKLGLERFHGVCIMGFNSPEWVFASFGSIFAGGFNAGIYTTNSPETCRHLIDNCQAQIIVVENETYLNKILAVKQHLPSIKTIVQWLGVPGAPGVLSWAELMAIGMHETDEQLNRRLCLSAVNQCCTIIYTSGTTGNPKGVMCSQDQLTSTAIGYKNTYRIGLICLRHISYLPLSHIVAQSHVMYTATLNVTHTFFAEPDALEGGLGRTLLEVKPHALFGVPRIWEKMYEHLQEASAQSGFLKSAMVAWARKQALNYYNALSVGRELSPFEKRKYELAKSLVFNRIKLTMGLENGIVFTTGSAPLSPKLCEYFMSIDIPIMEGYALSESLSASSVSRCQPEKFKLGSVGKPLPFTDVIIKTVDGYRKGEGEICMRGRNVCMGYLRMPDETDKVIDDDGLLHTGDIGYIDKEGFLHITGRLKELLITAGAENIPPALIEDAIKNELSFISNAMLIGDKRKYLSLLLTLKEEIDPNTGKPTGDLTANCINYLNQNKCTARTVLEAKNELKNNPEGTFSNLIQKGIDRYNARAISRAHKIQKWVVLPHDFSLPTGELNNTLKLKRSFVLQKYSHIIDTLYDGEANYFDIESKL